MKYMLRVGMVASALLFAGCGDLEKPQNEQAKGGEVLVDLDAGSVKVLLLKAGVAKADTTVYGYKAYKIPYETTDEEGNTVKVSGLMVVPQGMPDVVSNQIGYSLVSDDHGTIFKNAETSTEVAKATYAPSGSSVILTSLAGFITLQPDYIGFGDSNDHYHPFVLKKSLANATVDFIKTARVFASENDIKLNGQLFLTGYSEGGYAAMATLQKIEAEGELQVTMSAPMAGPYAFEAMAMGVLSQPKLSVPSFMANIGFAYANAYSEDISSVINEPYASSLEELFNGDKDRFAIDAELTRDTRGVFVGEFINSFFTNPNHWFKKAAQENNVHNWVPQSAVRLVHCEGDDVIPYAISQLTEATMKAMGATNIALVPVEKALAAQGIGDGTFVGHGECGLLAYQVATGMFAQTRKATVGY